jgi:hypothetical protein
VPPGERLSGPVSGRGDLIARLAAALVIDEGHRSGDPETRVGLDHRLPDPGRDDPSPRGRWRLATSSARLYPPPVARKPLSVWHSADGAKGRRLLAGDLANDNRVAAIDRRKIARGRVGLVRDSAIDVDLATLKLRGFRRGRRADGYDGDYYVVET